MIQLCELSKWKVRIVFLDFCRFGSPTLKSTGKYSWTDTAETTLVCCNCCNYYPTLARHTHFAGSTSQLFDLPNPLDCGFTSCKPNIKQCWSRMILRGDSAWFATSVPMGSPCDPHGDVCGIRGIAEPEASPWPVLPRTMDFSGTEIQKSKTLRNPIGKSIGLREQAVFLRAVVTHRHMVEPSMVGITFCITFREGLAAPGIQEPNLKVSGTLIQCQKWRNHRNSMKMYEIYTYIIYTLHKYTHTKYIEI